MVRNGLDTDNWWLWHITRNTTKGSRIQNSIQVHFFLFMYFLLFLMYFVLWSRKAWLSGTVAGAASLLAGACKRDIKGAWRGCDTLSLTWWATKHAKHIMAKLEQTVKDTLTRVPPNIYQIYHSSLPGSILENWPRDAKGAWIWGTMPIDFHAALCKWGIGMELFCLIVWKWVAQGALCNHSPRVVASPQSPNDWQANTGQCTTQFCPAPRSWQPCPRLQRNFVDLSRVGQGEKYFQGWELLSNKVTRPAGGI